ncbi:MAG: HTH domain-containing protein [Nanobdellota archaeon]
MENMIFLYSKGGESRRKIIQELYHQMKERYNNSVSTLAEELEISKVAVKRHVDRLIELGYIEKLNPRGKPIYLELTEKGQETAKKYLIY